MASINRKKLIQFRKSHAILIGINEYAGINAHLSTPVPDAEGLKEVLIRHQGFREEDIELLLNPTKAELEALLEKIKKSAPDPDGSPEEEGEEFDISKRDCLLFYYAGHGLAGDIDGGGPAGYILPSDARPETARLQNDSLLPMEAVFDAIDALDCHHTLLILDCCFAGSFRRISKTRATQGIGFHPMTKARFERYKSQRAWQVLASAGPTEKAADWMSERGENVALPDPHQNRLHSPFAKALIDALSNEASIDVKPRGKNLGDGVITAHELFLFLHNQVEEQTRRHEDFKPQNPDLFPMGKHAGGQFIFCDPRHPKNSPDWDKRKRKNPYKGLDQLDLADSDYYFGREADVQALLTKMQPHEGNSVPALLLVTGPSGSGKSSLVKAGYLPHLQEAGYEIFQIRPGEKPWVLKRFDAKRAKWKDFFEPDMPGLLAAAEWEKNDFLPLFPLDPTKAQVLLIDQYEELFTECSEAERVLLERELIRLFEAAAKGKLQLIISMRSDFDWQLELSDFGKKFWQKEAPLYPFFRLHRLSTLGLDDMRAALVNPGLLLAYEFEKDDTDDLVDDILSELNALPAALPLLSYTMQEMVKETGIRKRLFTRDTYNDKIGGVHGVLSKRMEEIYQTLGKKDPPSEGPGPHQQMLKNILLRMVHLSDGEYTRRRVFRRPGLDELRFAEDNSIAEAVLKELDKAQLISIGGDEEKKPFVELIHDSLINNWTTGKQWINEMGKENLTLQRQLWQAVEEHHSWKPSLINYNPGAGEQKPPLWDNNPKLQQLQLTITDPRDTWLCQKGWANKSISSVSYLMWEKKPSQAQLEEMAAWDWYFNEPDHAQRYQKIQDQMGKWLNEMEVDFVKKSFEQQQSELDKVKKERDEAQKTLRDLQDATNYTVMTMVDEAERLILHLQYKEALEKVRDASGLNALPLYVGKVMVELSLFYGEHDTALARELAQKAAELMEKPDLAKELEAAPKEVNAFRPHLHALLKSLDAELYESLRQKYFHQMVPIAGGRFEMGDADNKEPYAHPAHRVELSDFQLAQTPVTFWQYHVYCQATGQDSVSRIEGDRTVLKLSWQITGDNPVIGINWYQAAKYANWMSQRAGLQPLYLFTDDKLTEIRHQEAGYRLPTESEWEYAAVGGQAGYDDAGKRTYAFIGTSEQEAFPDFTWYKENSKSRTHPVASKNPNPLGIYDMGGNVWEWTQDGFHTYTAEARVDPVTPIPEKPGPMALRGGSWDSEMKDCRAINRIAYLPKDATNMMGFRMACVGLGQG